MSKFIVFLLLETVVCFSLGFNYAFYQVPTPPRTDLPGIDLTQGKDLLYSPVVRLVDSKTNEFFCSGTVISRNYIVTAGHCLEGRDKFKPSIKIVSASGKQTGALGVAAFYEGRSDQGLVLGDFYKFNIMAFSTDPVVANALFLGEKNAIISCGFPYGGDLYCSPLLHRRQYGLGIQAFGQSYPGCSGGPVIDVGTGLVIGVNTAVTEPGVYVSPLVELLTHAKVLIKDKE